MSSVSGWIKSGLIAGRARRGRALLRVLGQREVKAMSNDQRQVIGTEELGFSLPHDWNGNVQVQGNVSDMIDGVEYVEPATVRGVAPTFLGCVCAAL